MVCSHSVKHLLQIVILLSAITLLVTCITAIFSLSSNVHVARNMRDWSETSFIVVNSWKIPPEKAPLNSSLSRNTSAPSLQAMQMHFTPKSRQSLGHVQCNTTAKEHVENTTTKTKTVFSRVANYRSWEKGIITQIPPPVDRNCAKLMNGDKAELERVSNLLSEKNNKTNTSALYDYNTSCSQIKEEFLNNFYTSEDERSFPIAFTLVVHKNAQQTVRFLKAIYRPHNLYCIHPDPKSGEDFKEVFKLLSQCLGNVFLPSHIHNVTYNTQSTIFEAQLSCLRELEKHPSKWYYAINLCSRELPLKTNRFIVECLRELNGTSVVRPHPVDKHTFQERFPKMNIAASNSSEQTSLRHAEKCPRRNNTTASQSTEKCPTVTNTTTTMSDNQTVEQPPVNVVLPEQYSNLTFYKSMAYNALSRQFVHFFLHNRTTRAFLQWMIENVRIPEEHFYATIFMMPAAPGGFYSLPTPSSVSSLPLVYKSIWKHDHSSPYYHPHEKCASNYTVHEVCILTSAELPRIKQVMKWNVWFFNKYFMEDDHVVMDCVEEVLVRNNKQEFTRDSLHV